MKCQSSQQYDTKPWAKNQIHHQLAATKFQVHENDMVGGQGEQYNDLGQLRLIGKQHQVEVSNEWQALSKSFRFVINCSRS